MINNKKTKRGQINLRSLAVGIVTMGITVTVGFMILQEVSNVANSLNENFIVTETINVTDFFVYTSEVASLFPIMIIIAVAVMFLSLFMVVASAFGRSRYGLDSGYDYGDEEEEVDEFDDDMKYARKIIDKEKEEKVIEIEMGEMKEKEQEEDNVKDVYDSSSIWDDNVGVTQTEA